MSSSLSPGLIPSALDSHTQAFPVLTAAQIDRVLPIGKVRQVQSGEILFEPGDTNVPFSSCFRAVSRSCSLTLRASAPLQLTARASLPAR